MGYPKGVGKSPGSGRKPGSKNKRTLDSEAELDAYRQVVMKNLQPLLLAMLTAAVGSVVVLRKKFAYNKKTKRREETGEWKMEENAEEVLRLFNLQDDEKKGEDFYIITTKLPNAKAAEMLQDRLWGKPKAFVENSANKELLEEMQNNQRAILEAAKINAGQGKAE